MASGGILRNLRVSTRVVLAGLLITGFFVATTFIWLLPRAEHALIQRKREQIRDATEIAWSVLKYYHSQAADGALSLEEAQQRAATVVSGIRYGPRHKDYFWINDTVPRMIMHPYRPDLNGDDVSGHRDPQGKALFLEFVEVAREHGQGYVDYLWQWHDNPDHIVPKISYIRQFRPWSWIIGTGIYIQDVKAEIRAWRMAILVVYLLLTVVGVVVSAFAGQEVARSVRQREMAPDQDADRGGDPREEWTLGLGSAILVLIFPPLVGLSLLWSIELYRNLDRIVVGGFDRKVAAVSSVCGAFVRGEDHRAISRSGDEDGPLYRAYARRMRRVRDSTGMTYLYSQELDGNRCRYVLDVSDEWDTIGAGEVLSPDDYEGARNVMVHGVVHVGDIEPTENWGLLKYAYGPVFNDDETVEAMVGADVNIAVIRSKMRPALFSVSLMCVAALLIGGYASVRVSSRLARPVNQVKESTLRAAGGEYDVRIAATQPTEIHHLAERFNTIAATLARTLGSFQTERREARKRAELRQLTAAIDWESCGGYEKLSDAFAGALLNANADRKTASGWIATDGYAIGWVAPQEATSLDTVRRRADIARIARAVTRTRRPGAVALCAELRLLLGERLSAIVVRAPQGSGIAAAAYADATLFAGAPEKLVRLRTGPEPHVTELDNDDIVVLADPAGLEGNACLSDEVIGAPGRCEKASAYVESVREALGAAHTVTQLFFGVWHG